MKVQVIITKEDTYHVHVGGHLPNVDLNSD